jgi:hypothetical protein
MKDFGRFGLLFPCRVATAVSLVASCERTAGSSLRAEAPGRSAAAAWSLEEALVAPVPSRSHLALVVQTNFQVVAYIRSKLHISTLGLFCDVSTFRRLPNVIFYHPMTSTIDWP